MNRKILGLLTSTFLLVSILSGVAYIHVAKSETAIPDYEAVDWQSGLAGPVEFPTPDESEIKSEMPETFLSISLPTIESFSSTPPVGTHVWDWYLWSISQNDYGGPKATMTLRAIGEYSEVWVQDDLRFPFNATYNDPRNNDPIQFTITDEMCQYLADTFDSIVYPIDTAYFGVPLDRDGTGNYFIGRTYPTAPPNWWYWIDAPGHGQRVIIKVLNYRDTNYYDPTYPSYVAGFYSSSYTKTYYKRNMIHLDCWQWWRRLGPVGHQWFLDRPDLVVPEDRANLYESVLAHEYQHLIHSDYNSRDPTWMNEGCSEFAQIICGWPHTLWSHINNFLATPDNSLTVWSDQGDINILADYGAAALFVTYLSDNYGGADLISYFVKSGVAAPSGINNALTHFGYTATFNDVFHDWRIANIIHSDSPGEGRYNYKTLDLGKPPAIPARTYTINGLPVPLTKGTNFGNTWTYLGYDTGISKIREYGTDYIILNGWQDMGLISFDGEDNKQAIVTVIQAYVEKKGEIKYIINDMNLSTPALTGTQGVFILEPNYVILAISYIGSAGWSDYNFSVQIVPTPIATIIINPTSLNLKSSGKWITAYIELPEGYNVNDIDVSTVLVNFTVPVDSAAPNALGDYDNDGIPDLMVKFNRAEIISFAWNNIDIENRFGTATLRITGYLTDGTPFQSKTTIKIILPAIKEKLFELYCTC